VQALPFPLPPIEEQKQIVKQVESLFTLAYGLDAVASGKYRRLVVVKPVIDVTTIPGFSAERDP
jgi:hypothetical protein